MKNVMSFEEFVNEEVNFLFEARQYFKAKNNPKAFDEFTKKYAQIKEEIIHSAATLPGVEVVDDLTKIFPDAKKWWQKGNPDPSAGNPQMGGITSRSNQQVSKYKWQMPSDVSYFFDGSDEDRVTLSEDYGDIKVFVKTEDITKVWSAWHAKLLEIGKKHGIPVGEWVYNPTQSLLVSEPSDKPDDRQYLWWSDENGGESIQAKYPELGYVCMKLPFQLIMRLTPEESKAFAAPLKMKAAWPMIKKLIDPTNSASVADQEDDPNWSVVGSLKLGDFIQVWSEFYASEDFGVNLDIAEEITNAIISQIGPGTPVKSKADFVVSGSEMRQAYMGNIAYIRWDWDGPSLFVHKNDLKKFEALCKGIKVAV
jgi:hypothetical protein